MKKNIYNIWQNNGMRFSLCALALFVGMAAYAQDESDDFDEDAPTIKTPRRVQPKLNIPTVEVKGTVVDLATGKPLAGARLNMLGDARFAGMTDAEGKFKISVPKFATALYVQAPKYGAQQVAIKSDDAAQNIEIKLLSDKFASMYSESTDITAKSSFNASGKGLSIDEEVTEKMGADVRANMHSGNLENGASMFIRGINSISANSQPLVIVDGVEIDMQRNRTSLHLGDIFNMLSTISPEDIDKVTVLKNATALYGARGANGVILIDTKRGHSLATRIEVKAGIGTTMVPTTATMMNAAQYRNYAVEQLGTISEVVNSKANTGEQMTFQFLNDSPNGYYYNTYHNDTKWKDYVYRSALTHNYSINVQGGDDIGMYNLSVAYIQTMKNLQNTSYDRVNVRFNTDIVLTNAFTTKFDISFSRTNTNLFDDGISSDLSSGAVTSPGFLAQIKSPLLNPYQYNHNIQGFTSLFSEADDLFKNITSLNTSLGNPVALISSALGERKNRNENTFFNVAIAPSYEFNRNLKFTTHFSYYLNRNSQAYYRPNIGMPSFSISELGTVYAMVGSNFAKQNSFTSNSHLDWHKKFDAHDVAVSGGFRFVSFNYNSNILTTQNKVQGKDDKNPTLVTGDNYYTTIGGSDDSWKNMQWYVSGDYNYKNRAFATVSLLAEANSRFGANASGGLKVFGTKWAIFPSVQLGVVLTNYDWFPKNSFVNYLRINAGFDISGNDDISNYAASTAFSSVRYNSTYIGMQLTNVGNDQIKWESTKKFNVGLVANMFNNRLGFNADFYVHNTTDLLTLKSFENPVGGINNYWTNDGSVRNVGVELGINGKPVVSKNWTLELGATMGHYKNKVTSLAGEAYTSSIYGTDNILTAVGGSVGQFYGYQTADHVFATTEEAQAANLRYIDETGAEQKFTAGDVHFIDQNGDGIIDEKDKVVIGNPNPDFYGNIFAHLTWKRFSLGVNFNYSVGNDIYNYERSVLNSGSTLYNQQVAEVGRWRYEGQITDLPRAAYGDPKGNNRFSDRWIEDGSYLRLKTITLSYQIPVPESWQTWLQGVSVWGEVRNVFTLTKYTGNDPEVSISNNQLYQGIDAGNIVQGRSFNFGLKINL